MKSTAPWMVVCGLPALALCGACSGDSVAAGGSDQVGFLFVDVAAEAGLEVVNVCGDPRRWYIPESNGCGAAWLDYDGDGDQDLFIGNGARLSYIDDGRRLEVVPAGQSRLYRNEGELRFTDVSAEAGADRLDWVNSVTVADIEGDGDPDIYLSCFGPDVLLVNERGVFHDGTAAAGLGNEAWSAGACFGDLNRDGTLDLFVGNYVDFDLNQPPDGGRRVLVEGVEVGWGPEGENGQGINPGASNLYYLGAGAGHFREATQAAGLRLEQALCSYAVVFSDVNGDGAPDILVANDMQPANLFMNDGAGSFTDAAVERGFAFNGDGAPTSAMGLAVADVDSDGDFDCLRTNFDFEPNSLHLNNGAGQFREVAAAGGLAAGSLDRLGWGGGFFDADSDGDLDLLIANGHVFPQAEEIGMHAFAQQSQLFECVGSAAAVTSWRDASAEAGPGLALARSARGVAFGDPDDDGDLDVLIVDLDHAPRLLENRTPRRGAWLGLALAGLGGNRDGLGARVSVEAGGRTWVQEARRTQGLYSSHDPRLVFGLGAARTVERVTVLWPDGTRQVLTGLATNAYHTIAQPARGAGTGGK
ncbi:MAG TPA: CRTAC1 family protein [Planctomycetota bacterium]|nr:CRTAC1 family protein [Planctomycetota bacterium]